MRATNIKKKKVHNKNIFLGVVIVLAVIGLFVSYFWGATISDKTPMLYMNPTYDGTQASPDNSCVAMFTCNQLNINWYIIGILTLLISEFIYLHFVNISSISPDSELYSMKFGAICGALVLSLAVYVLSYIILELVGVITLDIIKSGVLLTGKILLVGLIICVFFYLNKILAKWWKKT